MLHSAASPLAAPTPLPPAAGADAGPRRDAPHRIRPLPADVTAQLRSTLTITGLTQAVSELVQNSLDAGARSVRIHVNCVRNSCMVEDDGCGIDPEDLPLLGTRYATSKYTPGAKPSTFGHLGTTLASLTTDSILTLITRPSTHRSTYIARFSYSSTPTSTGHAPDHLRLQQSGTTVRIESLFGNLPVRIKAHQANLDEEKEWERLKRVLAALLLSGNRDHILRVGIILRDGSNRKLIIKPRREKGASSDNDDDSHSSTESLAELRLLHQFYSVKEIGLSSTWERVRAKHGPISIEGWISIAGAPSRRYQFISINSHPLSPPPQSTNVIHATLNHLFSKSTFGTVVDNPEEKSTKKANKPRKGVDRFPKCILRIECIREGDGATHDEHVLVGGEGGTGDGSGGKGGVEGENLRLCLELLEKLVRQFLKVHNFKPTTRGRSSKDASDYEEEDGEHEEEELEEEGMQVVEISDESEEVASDEQIARPKKPTPQPTPNLKSLAEAFTSAPPSRKSTPSRPSSSSSSSFTTKRQQRSRLSRESTREPSIPHLSALEGWGARVKAARRDPVEEEGRQIVGSKLPAKASSSETTSLRKTPIIVIPDNDDEAEDSILRWRNPVTSRTAEVDARTGNTRRTVLKHRLSRSRTPSEISLKRLRIGTPSTNSSTDSLSENIPPGEKEKPPFISSLLENWKNPVFAPPEPPIPVLGPTANLMATQQEWMHTHLNGGGGYIEKMATGLDLFKDMAGLGSEKLTKEGLRRARVVGQVDRKFVLVVMPVTGGKMAEKEGGDGEGEGEGEGGRVAGEDLLVIIDQHAADERWRVEALMEELCREQSLESAVASEIPAQLPEDGGDASTAPNPAQAAVVRTPQSRIATAPIPLNKAQKYSINEAEHSLLSRPPYIQAFSTWGILYTLSPPEPPTSDTKATTTSSNPPQSPTFTLTHVPRLILDRILTTPSLGAELVRSHLWDLADRQGPPHPPSAPASEQEQATSKWPSRLHNAPKKLLELVNSRACRSAIMFGDELTKKECEVLVGRMSGTVFPFMCAHGRPSGVPLVRMGRQRASGAGEGRYTAGRMGLRRGFGMEVGGEMTTARGVGWIGDRKYARVGGEEGGGEYGEAYRRWRERERGGKGVEGPRVEREEMKVVDLEGMDVDV
ncbi:hypothetical protein BDZ91DRAFT_845230 [Kalaharituber pfeilii]|nr:hypothetical protein BDZ91DRAFT_845230 [Kalaharituber pfeilii]